MSLPLPIHSKAANTDSAGAGAEAERVAARSNVLTYMGVLMNKREGSGRGVTVPRLLERDGIKSV